MLRRFKINEHGKKYLVDKPTVKKRLLDNKIISEHDGSFYIVKGDPRGCITICIKRGRIPRRLKVTKDGFVYGKFYNPNSRVRYFLPVSYNPRFTQKVFSTYPPDEIVRCEGNKLKIKGDPNLLASLLYNSNLREIPLNDLIKEWSDVVKILEELEGQNLSWSYD